MQHDQSAVEPHQTLFVPRRRRFLSNHVPGGGQIGDANLLPGALDLTSMTANWNAVLRAGLAVREQFIKVYPQSGRRWKLGDLHFLCCGIVAVPTLQLMRWRNPVESGELDPVMSSLFRIADNVRLACFSMLDFYEQPVLHDHPVSARELTQAAECDNRYLSTSGLCGAPPGLLREFVETLLAGNPAPSQFEDPGSWTAEIPAALTCRSTRPSPASGRGWP
jgi:hypothetical protein